jgi:hypothetical protein
MIPATGFEMVAAARNAFAIGNRDAVAGNDSRKAIIHQGGWQPGFALIR